MFKPKMSEWNFIRMETGKPVEKNVVESILTTIKEKGVIDSSEMGIGIEGNAQNAFGYDIEIPGLRSKLINIRSLDSNSEILVVTTASYNEYHIEIDKMLTEKQANRKQAIAAAEERRIAKEKAGQRRLAFQTPNGVIAF